MEEQGMIERAAIAVLAKVPEGYGMTKTEALGYARATLAAMRTPSKAMLQAVEKIEDERYVGYERMPAEEAWPIMVDAALNEQEKG